MANNEVLLFKKNRAYEKDGERRNATNFYVKCGDELVPVQVRFFPNDEGVDANFRARKKIMSAFAEELPVEK